MARFVVMQKEEGREVITIFEEGVNQKKIRRETDVPYHLATMHKIPRGYEYANEKIQYIKGEQTK